MTTELRTRLPTLAEVLNRRTLPPVDLFSFYIYMRDQQRAVDYLDFWLDVSQHLSLCRLYVHELRRSMLVASPDPNEESKQLSRHSSKQSSASLEKPCSSCNKLPDEYDNGTLSAFLRRNDDRGADGEEPRVLYVSTPEHSDAAGPRTVCRPDIRASAERILHTYLIPGSEREIVLPAAVVRSVTVAIEEYGRDDPEIFDDGQEYVFQAMERDAYPNFLRAKALGNLVPRSAIMRLVFGLFALFGGFWTGFVLIFLDWRPRTTRLWLILPFTMGVYSLISHQYNLDPLLAMIGLTESTFFAFMRVREPYVRSLIFRRAVWVLCLTILIVVALVVLFALVPGYRL